MKPFKKAIAKKPVFHQESHNRVSEEVSIQTVEDQCSFEIQDLQSPSKLTIEDLKKRQKPLKAQVSTKNLIDNISPFVQQTTMKKKVLS